MKQRTRLHRALLAAGLAVATHAAVAADPPAQAGTQAVPAQPAIEPASLPASHQRSGLEIYQRFRDGLADPECDSEATNGRWKKHFSHAPGQLARAEDDVLPLFGYVVDALREAHLPTEFALIPFVESGYKPGARNPQGPAGLWQFIGITARNHGVPMREGYDGRLSPVDSTQAAVRYLKTLHGMFGGDWRLAVMAYNAGEYRVLQSMRRAGMNARNARPAELPGLSGITYAYVEKLHALACIFQQADDRDAWLRQMDRPVPRLAAHVLPGDATLDAWARAQQQPAALLKRLNPALAGRFSRAGKPMQLLAPTNAGVTDAAAPAEASAVPPTTESDARAGTRSAGRTHTVKSGDSAWTIARRHGITTARLLQINGLAADAVLRPGMVLKLDGDAD
ncbi:lytic transglycosylase domain-containing protein [Pseudoxanthomonas sp. PXM01]|uniref:lytic transglycosylase domain-containing protein n=1 Tax=Pseudoxanthomonas sp. PXM01 TaxID=2769295 RepID=UPI001783F5DF|nr:lytic transglycosylase domain-containing protein [Pseudoxanthomonas sp. PXM01]MBD9469326.1 transglycosylase SLT domain-containing protein [Pseudoxanthomonas sp. PXM01]